MNLAIVIFAFNRPAQLQSLLDSLLPHIGHIPVHLCIDGPRTTVDTPYIEQCVGIANQYHCITCHVNRCNKGLSSQILDSLGYLFKQFNYLIVLEDDLVLSPFFMDYMINYLPYLSLQNNILQISGHMFDLPFGFLSSPFLLPCSTSWGWATSSEIWNSFQASFSTLDPDLVSNKFKFNLYGCFGFHYLFAKASKGLISSWAIFFYAFLFSHSGRVIHPPFSLVANYGFSKHSTHGSALLSLMTRLTGNKCIYKNISFSYVAPINNWLSSFSYFVSVFVCTVRPLSFLKNIAKR